MQKTTPQVSIIVPVYNVEDYLERCLNSIQAQTLKKWECICIDDGSTDGSGAVLDAWAAKDARFVVIHKENGGTSTARNAGLEKARGEYIGFVDPDDWIESETYELAFDAAQRTGADIVQWGTILELGDKAIPTKVLDEGFFDIARDYDKGYSGGACDKLFKASFIFENGIRFPAGVRRGEDVSFSVMAYALAQRVFCLARALYHYDRTRENSSTNLNFTEEALLEDAASRKRTCEQVEKILGRGGGRLREFLFSLKLIMKSYFLAPHLRNYRLFRSIFPEVNKQMPLYFLKTRTRHSFKLFLAAYNMEALIKAVKLLKKKLRGLKR